MKGGLSALKVVELFISLSGAVIYFWSVLAKNTIRISIIWIFL